MNITRTYLSLLVSSVVILLSQSTMAMEQEEGLKATARQEERRARREERGRRRSERRLRLGGTAQEEKDADYSTMRLQFSNQSEKVASFFFSKGSNITSVLAPYQSSDSIVVSTDNAIHAHTSTGAWVIESNKEEDLLTLYKLDHSHNDNNNAEVEWTTDKEIVKQVPAKQAKDIIFIVNPQGQAGIFLRAPEKESEVSPETQIADSEEKVEKAEEVNCDNDDIMPAIKDPQEMLYQAILHDSAEEIRNAIQADVDVNAQRDGKSFLFWAIALKKFNSAKILLEHEAIDIDKTLITKAFNGGHGDITLVLSLIRKGADISEFMNDVYISLILRHGHVINKNQQLELMQELINRGYNVNNFWKILHGCHGHIENQAEIIDFFIKNGVNPNYQVNTISPDQYWTPLVILIDQNDTQAVKTLLAKGANINQKLKTGYPRIHTPLSYALERGLTEMAEFLLKHGARID